MCAEEQRVGLTAPQAGTGSHDPVSGPAPLTVALAPDASVTFPDGVTAFVRGAKLTVGA